MPKRKKSALLHDKLRAVLQTGRYARGQRIDAKVLAREFDTSPTPVLYALYRLMGEGSVVDLGHEGFRVPLMTEVALHDLYDWMQRLLIMACEIGPAHDSGTEKPFKMPIRQAAFAMTTRNLFETIALSTNHHYLHFAVRQANNWLGPTRRAAQTLLPDAAEELADLIRHWQAGRLDELKAALIAYYERRQRLVPQIVAALEDPRKRRATITHPVSFK